jgi:hypothetical protein
LAILNSYGSEDQNTERYIENPREKIDTTIMTLSANLRKKLLDEEVFKYVSEAIITDIAGSLQATYYRNIMRREFVRAIVSQREEKDFSEKINFLKDCAVFLSKQELKKEDKSSKKKSDNLMKIDLSTIEGLRQRGSYAEARSEVLEILSREGNLDLTNSVNFINKVEEALSYRSAAEYLEGLANNRGTNLESRKKFYEQAVEECSHFDPQRQSIMMNKVQELQEEIGKVKEKIKTAGNEADDLAKGGNWEEAVKRLDTALADVETIGQEGSNIAEDLKSKKDLCSRANRLTERIKRETDITRIAKLERIIINTKLPGCEKLQFLLKEREHELREDELSKRLNALKNPTMPSRAFNILKSQEAKDEEIRVVTRLLNMVREEREGLKEGETPEQRNKKRRRNKK